MLIGGLQKVTLIDYPKKIAATIFVQGCPFRCHYCHNSELVLPDLFKTPIAEEEVLKFLKGKVGKLDGVVISGGEPTCQSDLSDFIKKVKDLGFLVKIDTSGINPQVLTSLLELKFIDYIAMDLKAPIKKYFHVIGKKVDLKKIEESINIILKSGIPHEFRSTIIEGLHSPEDVLEMARLIKNADLYVLQKFNPKSTINPLYMHKKSFTNSILEECKKEIEKFVPCQIR